MLAILEALVMMPEGAGSLLLPSWYSEGDVATAVVAHV